MSKANDIITLHEQLRKSKIDLKNVELEQNKNILENLLKNKKKYHNFWTKTFTNKTRYYDDEVNHTKNNISKIEKNLKKLTIKKGGKTKKRKINKTQKNRK